MVPFPRQFFSWSELIFLSNNCNLYYCKGLGRCFTRIRGGANGGVQRRNLPIRCLKDARFVVTKPAVTALVVQKMSRRLR
ncbi:MAG: hypothetical protein CMJ81_15370 [Planctomycetaceae bacterium]|nr:hypothetical protein [Planctomycetaceae bacterium]MBP62775.1 hypothetical protein [Planctomycetaceae bacterium]